METENAILTETSTRILDSFLVKTKAEMRAVLEDFNNSIDALAAQLIKLDRQEFAALTDAEARFDNRCKESQEERRAFNKHYINEAEKRHEAYLQHVEENRQLRIQEEGGVEA